MMGRCLEALALERDDALVALHMRALVDGHAHVALAQQVGNAALAGPDGGLDGLGVELGAGAQPVRGVEIDDDHRHRTVGLGLEDEPALEFQRGPDQRRQHHGLAQEARHRLWIVVTPEDRVDGRAKPHHASTAIERLEREGHDNVIAAFRPVEAEIVEGKRSHQISSMPKDHNRMAFCMCRRFSASSNTTDCGPSMTSSVTSSPRCAGRQCMNRA